ncbi:hypothetical protein Glove_311g65 [Diversispora epigaea]|uniref:Serine-threonine/tyrosine-protein kinase catalytic domain-containing protein n=1 Tax=Diversispora epigaea TaxID=1348612 RepID=A0A397HS03_9GLOM|nr:hypothetical protein Glove_311g65 [Diversispora epigaea]
MESVNFVLKNNLFESSELGLVGMLKLIRPKIPDIMLDWIPKFYSDLVHKCWSANPSEQPTSQELMDIADENQEKAIKSQKQESSLSSSISHPQTCYIFRSIHTLHGLHPNLLMTNEPTTSSVSAYDIDSKESQECIDWGKEIQN